MDGRAKPPNGKAKTKRPLARKSPKTDAPGVHELETRLAEALEQQAATAEILRVISRSPTDTQPVFNTIVASAARLCDADFSAVARFEGGLLHLVAVNNMSPAETAAYHTVFPRAPGRHFAIGRAFVDARPVHIEDIEADPDYDPWTRQILQGAAVYRTFLGVPILQNGVPIGAIGCGRHEMRPFTASQIELVKTFADQAVIAVENVRLFTELQARNSALTESLDQQTATGEILRVISSSPTDVQPVFAAVAASAARLCDAFDATIFQVDTDGLRVVARVGPIPAHSVGQGPSMVRGTPPGRAVLDRRTIHVADMQTEIDEYPEGSANARRFGHRTTLVVPLLHAGEAIGAIAVRRTEVRPFTDRQVELLKTFADQAVIAIENVRLFNELQRKNEALTEAHAQVTEALDQQTATSEILRVISSSPTDVQPVLDAVTESAARLCDAAFDTVNRFDGRLVTLGASYHVSPEELAVLQRDIYPFSPTRQTASGRALIDRATVHIHDIRSDPQYTPVMQAPERYRTVLAVPMLREGTPIGNVTLCRREVRPFSDKQIELVKTFADQAVIAIENVRLFTELQEKNRALTQAHEQVTQALEQQTATSEILRVISSSLTDVQPVFDAIAGSATRLCDALYSVVFRFDGDTITLVADDGASPEQLEVTRSAYPAPPGRRSVAAQAILERRVIAIADAQSGTEYPHVAERAKSIGYRSIVSVPMLRGDTAIGAINVLRVEALPFSDTQIELLKTFAGQAVIAIENVRLFKELEARTAALTRSVDQLTALGEVGRAVTSTLDLETVLTTIVSRAVQLSGLDGGVVFEYDDGAEEFVQRVTTETDGALAEARRTTRIRKGEGVLGRTAITLEPVQVPDIAVPGAYEGRLRETLIASGVRAILAVPMVRENRLIGCLGVTRNRPGEFPVETIELLRTFATQSALAIQNARLFHEIEDKSRQLEVVSQHKSEFLANMSHELRTPLNAIIGFSEVLSERMFGELNEKQEEYLRDIYASGQHLLSLINDILDLSKIEAGRMELELTDFDLPQAIDNAMMLVRERAERRGISLSRVVVDRRLGQIRGDERKIRQVVLNLLSNAIKFTPEGGCIEVRAVPADGRVEVSVSDTGVGIAPEDQEAVFEEFRQVGASATKQEGTGLGLTLCRKFVELHGGKIWVKSQVGGGSTFTFTLPLTTNQRRQTA